MNQLTTKIDKQFLGRLCADAISNLERACEKHPTFPAKTTNMDLASATNSLEEVRSTNESGHSAVGLIATEEELEFNVEMLQGNQAAAYNELVDLITVWLRVGCHLGDYVSKAVTGNLKLETGKACPVDEEACDLCAGVRGEPCPDAKPLWKENNAELRLAMSAVCMAFNQLTAERKGNACIHGVECLRRALDKSVIEQVGAVDESAKGIGAPGDWGYDTPQGKAWYQLLVVCDKADKEVHEALRKKTEVKP
jgi:hypothetical protein